MPTNAGLHGVLTIRLAQKMAPNDDARASAVLGTLRHLAPHAVTLDEGDTLVDLQVAALELLGTGACGTARDDALRRFREAWLAFDALWTTRAEPVGFAALHQTKPRGHA